MNRVEKEIRNYIENEMKFDPIICDHLSVKVEESIEDNREFDLIYEFGNYINTIISGKIGDSHNSEVAEVIDKFDISVSFEGNKICEIEVAER